jgi:uncharacterized C2H2 Zn-finger protein
MILKEIAVERFTFSCPGCDRTWSTDYDVQHVEDGHGHQHDYYSRNGLSIVCPFGARAVICPRCGRDQLHVRLTARRSTTPPNP